MNDFGVYLVFQQSTQLKATFAYATTQYTERVLSLCTTDGICSQHQPTVEHRSAGQKSSRRVLRTTASHLPMHGIAH